MDLGLSTSSNPSSYASVTWIEWRSSAESLATTKLALLFQEVLGLKQLGLQSLETLEGPQS